MNLKELHKIKYLRFEIERFEEKARRADERAQKITASFSFAPGGTAKGCRLENAAIDALQYRAKAQELSNCRDELLRIIYSCDDMLVKNALILRYDLHPGEENPTWSYVAKKLGTTPDSLRVACSRFLEKIDIKTPADLCGSDIES